MFRPEIDRSFDLSSLESGFPASIDAEYRKILVARSLHDAVEKNDEEFLEQLLNDGADVDARNPGNMTPLHVATVRGHLTLAERLLARGARVDASIYDGIVLEGSGEKYTGSAVYFAVRNADAPMTRLLLDGGADSLRDPNLLGAAIDAGNLDVVEHLLNRRNVDVDAADSLHRAVVALHPEDVRARIVEALIHRGADVRRRNCNGQTPLHVAAQRGHAVLVATLLGLGNSAVVAKNSGRSGKYFQGGAKNSEHSGKYFQDEAKNFGPSGKYFQDEAKNSGRSGKYFQSETKNSGRSGKYFQDEAKNSGPSGKYFQDEVKNSEHSGKYFPDEAKNSEHSGKYFQDEAKNSVRSGKYFHEAENSVDIAELNKAAQLSARSENGETALHAASARNHREVVEILLRCGVDIAARTNHGKTALDVAFENGCRQSFVVLLNYGADINVAYIATIPQRDRPSFSVIRYGRGEFITSNRFCVDSIRRHIVRVRCSGRKVTAGNLRCLDDEDDALTRYRRDCDDEVRRMRGERVEGCVLSFRDVLSRDENRLAAFAGNATVARVLETKSFELKFPIYCDMIRYNFRRGQIRGILLNVAANIFYRTVDDSLPVEVVVGHVFAKLRNEDVANFIDACDVSC